MAVSEETIDKLVAKLNKRTKKANEYFLKKIGEELKKIKKLSPSEAHKLVKILKYGGNYQDIVRELNNISGIPKKEIEIIFDNYAKIDQNFYKNFYEYRNKEFIPFEKNLALRRQTRALAEIVGDEFKNFTRARALGYSFRDAKGNIKFHGLKETYERLLDEAVINLDQGKESFNSAMSKILEEIGGSGLRTLDYNGRAIRLDSMIDMHLRSSLNNLHNENEKIIAKEIDADGIEISVHEMPAPDHTDAQGRQFSNVKPSKDELSEWEKLQEGLKATTYQGDKIQITHSKTGTYRPISEFNCLHYVFSIVLGVQNPQYSDKELQEIKERNQKGFEFDGKHYTLYEGSQLQRTIERKIREQEDINTLAKESGDLDLELKSANKRRKLLQKYKRLSDVSGLDMRTERLSSRSYPVKEIKEPVELEEEVIEEPKVVLNDVKDVKFAKTSKIFKKSRDILDLTNNENINFYNATDKLKIDISERKNLKSCRYSRWDKTVYTRGVDAKDIEPDAILWHELGHALDNNSLDATYLSNSTEIRTAMYNYYQDNKKIPESVVNYFKSFRELSDKEFEEENNFEDYFKNFVEIRKNEGANEYRIKYIQEMKEKNDDDYKNYVKNYYSLDKTEHYRKKQKTDIEYAQMGHLSDMFSSISYGEYNKDFCFNYGYHSKKYFNDYPYHPSTELFANFVSLKMTGSKKNLEFFKKECPEIYKLLEELFKKIGDDLGAK